MTVPPHLYGRGVFDFFEFANLEPPKPKASVQDAHLEENEADNELLLPSPSRNQ